MAEKIWKLPGVIENQTGTVIFTGGTIWCSMWVICKSLRAPEAVAGGEMVETDVDVLDHDHHSEGRGVVVWTGT